MKQVIYTVLFIACYIVAIDIIKFSVTLIKKIINLFKK